MLVAGVVLVWLLYPREYNYQKVMRLANPGCACRCCSRDRRCPTAAAAAVATPPASPCTPPPSSPQALSDTLFFFDTQREGRLPLSNPVPWRGDAFVGDYQATVTLAASMPNGSDFLSFGFVSSTGHSVLCGSLLPTPLRSARSRS